MIRLPDHTPFGGYTVQRFIKEGLYNDSYIVKGEDGLPYFMKFYDMSRMPDKMILGGTVEEILHCRELVHPNIIRHVLDGSGQINGKGFQYLITKFFDGKLLSEALREGRRRGKERDPSGGCGKRSLFRGAGGPQPGCVRSRYPDVPSAAVAH